MARLPYLLCWPRCTICTLFTPCPPQLAPAPAVPPPNPSSLSGRLLIELVAVAGRHRCCCSCCTSCCRLYHTPLPPSPYPFGLSHLLDFFFVFVSTILLTICFCISLAGQKAKKKKIKHKSPDMQFYMSPYIY